MNQVEMKAGVVRGEETIHYPADEIHVRGVGHGNVQVAEYVSRDREDHRCTRISGTRSKS